MLRIVPYPHPALRYESRPIERIDDALRSQVREMFDLMYEHKGIGLAANQVGLPFRFFILNTSGDPAQADQERVFINPTIVKRHSSIVGEEGCLSFPGIYGPVQRAKKIRVKAFDLDGNLIDTDADDLLGRAIQHEIDHLDGKLFIDHLDPDERSKVDLKIKEQVNAFFAAQAAGEWPSDAEMAVQLEEMARGALV